MQSDLPATLPETASLDALADPAQYVLVSCERAKTWLAQALDGNHIEQIIEIKSQAEALRVYTMQKQLGKDAELSATEIVRRAERCIGLTIRKGQEKGTIAKKGDQRSDQIRSKQLISPAAYLDSSYMMTDTYAMTDGVSDAEFEKVIHSAKAERNLSRANVVRKIKGNGKADRWAPLAKLADEGHTSDQIAKKIGVTRETVAEKARALGITIRADRVLGRSKRADSTRVLREFASTLDSLIPSCELIEPAKVDRSVLSESLSILDEAIRALSKLRTRLRKGGTQ